MEYYGAIDQGTTSSRFIVFDNEGNIVEQHQEEFNQYFPNEYSVEHNPEEIWKSVVNCINEVLKKIDVNNIKSIGISNQRETTVAWSKSTGKPLFNAIVWQDTRTQSICDDISNNQNIKEDIKRTGLPIATYFSLSKILWLIENVPEVHSSLEKDDVIFGTIDSWLIYKLNGTFQTDVTNASRTLLLDLDNLNWNLPWDAGAQFSSFCVYSTTQNFNIKKDLINFIDKKVDIDTGSYFTNRPSNPRQIINGAMKVITGLDWLGEEIHYPKNLIDFCLNNKPIQEGCDIVDFVYTLYMCSQQTDYKKKEINDLFVEISKDIFDLYFNEDGGFSYFQNKSQSHYYGIKITNSLKTPDLHGTLLCLWSINMILNNMDRLEDDKQIIKP